MVDLLVEFNPDYKEEVKEIMEEEKEEIKEKNEKGIIEDHALFKKARQAGVVSDDKKAAANALGQYTFDYKFREDGKLFVHFSSVMDYLGGEMDEMEKNQGMLSKVKGGAKKFLAKKALSRVKKSTKKKIKKAIVEKIGEDNFYSIEEEEREED